MIADSAHSVEEEEALVRAFLSQRVAGLALDNTTHTATSCQMIAKAGIPVVENGNISKEPPVSTVSYSNFEASRMMVVISRGFDTRTSDLLLFRHWGMIGPPSAVEAIWRPSRSSGARSTAS